MAPKKVSSKDGAAPEKKEESTEEAVEAKIEEAKAETKVEEAEAKVEEGATEEAETKEEDKEAEEEEAKEPEKPKELEEDFAVDSRTKVAADAVAWSSRDCTLSVLPVVGGSLFSSLSDGGMQYLLSSVRAMAGLKAGRYMFEARMLEKLNPDQGHKHGSNKAPEPRQLFRVGLSLADSSLFLGDSQDNICFDSEGFFVHGKKKTKLSGSVFGKGTIAVVLNLDLSSPNANTVSLFKNGQRVGKPQEIPENMRGKPLFPTVTYRNVTFESNFGPTATKPLPFTCRMVKDAAADDLVVVKEEKPKDGKYDVLFPVGLPDQGLFDWVDEFLEKNPGYTELSDRTILEWAGKSGIWKPKNTYSNDKPAMQFGIPLMDDGSVKRLIQAIAPTQQRNFIVPELKANLVKTEREKSLALWAGRHFKRTAAVVMGTPSKDYKDRVHKVMLKAKLAKAESARKKKVAELKRERLLAEKKKKAEEAKKAKEKKKEGEEETKVEEPAAEDSKDPEDEVPPATAELDAEELALTFRKTELPDISEKALAKAYASFTLPETAEGFDKVDFIWDSAEASAEALQKFIKAHKLTTKCEDLQPSAWFKEQSAAWSKQYQEWKKLANDWKDPAKKKAMIQKLIDAKKEAGEEDPKLPEVKDIDSLDVFTVEDVANVGSGEPLFSKFSAEDWALLSIRYELFLLMHAFRKDLDDEERKCIPEAHLSFYYNKYYKKTFSVESFGFKTFGDFAEIIKDVVVLAASGLCEGQLPEDTPLGNFLKLTEEHRRDRIRRVDAGDETAKLKFKPMGQRPQGEKGEKGSGKSSWNKAATKDKEASRPARPTTSNSAKGNGKSNGAKSNGSPRPWEARKTGGAPAVRNRFGSSAPAAPERRWLAPVGRGSQAPHSGGAPKRSWASSAPVSRAPEPAWKRSRPTPSYSGGKGGNGGHYRR